MFNVTSNVSGGFEVNIFGFWRRYVMSSLFFCRYAEEVVRKVYDKTQRKGAKK